MALIASYIQRDIPGHQIHIGEIDLLRKVRKIAEKIILDLWESIESKEIRTPVRILCPPESADLIREEVKGVTVMGCERLDDAVYQTWPDLRPK
jgi:predicted ATP-dependent serine protease